MALPDFSEIHNRIEADVEIEEPELLTAEVETFAEEADVNVDLKLPQAVVFEGEIDSEDLEESQKQ